MKITFILPEDNRSGGVRVTVIMANMLLESGHDVRIVCVFKKRVADRIRSIYKRMSGSQNTGWLYQFNGPVIEQTDLNRLSYVKDELVISVGTYTIESMISIESEVIKLRYNHGLPALMDEKSSQLWSCRYPTITVSKTLVPLLEEMCPGSVLGVVPNGIDQSKYYDMEHVRTGIGVFYNSHPNKAPDFIVSVVNAIHQRDPLIPIYVISGEKCPSQLSYVNYYNYPPVEKVTEIYNKCKLWLLPSDTEGLPGPVLEAMSCGTVVISTDNDGSMELITDKVNGLISPKRNLELFVDNVFHAYSNEELRMKLGQAGKMTANEFNWDNSLKAMKAILDKLLSRT